MILPAQLESCLDMICEVISWLWEAKRGFTLYCNVKIAANLWLFSITWLFSRPLHQMAQDLLKLFQTCVLWMESFLSELVRVLSVVFGLVVLWKPLTIPDCRLERPCLCLHRCVGVWHLRHSLDSKTVQRPSQAFPCLSMWGIFNAFFPSPLPMGKAIFLMSAHELATLAGSFVLKN